MTQRRIAIDALLPPGGQLGGVETHLMALVRALGELDGPEQYLIVCPPEHPGWLDDFLGPNQEIVLGPSRARRGAVKELLGRAWPAVWRLVQQVWLKADRGRMSRVPPGWVWESNGFFESLDAALVHVFIQKYLRSTIPTVFNPHDLQHEHFPEFFDPMSLARRKFVYSRACRSAAAVVAASAYTRQDVMRHYGVASDRVWTIPFGPPTAAYPAVTEHERSAVLERYGLRGPFMLYPAVTWAHKNHLALLKALVSLRSEGVALNLVCTGSRQEPVWSQIQQFVNEQELAGQVHFPGVVPAGELRALYQLCQFVIAPSLFEQACGPMYEGWQEGAPVTASNVTSIPDQAGDAALLFDPSSVEAIARAVRQMTTSPALRDALRKRGARRLRDFSWDRTARAYRALYRSVACWPLTDEDRFLLGWDWMIHPERPSSKVTIAHA